MSRFDELIQQYRHKGLLLDTNLILLLLIGRLNIERISQFKRTQSYTPDDYHLLTSVYEEFSRFATTPHVLTEVSNLLGQLQNQWKLEYFRVFAEYIHSVNEVAIATRKLAAHPDFVRFGLSDISILKAAATGYLVLTDDAPLSVLLDVNDAPVINFTHLRAYLL